MARQRRPQLAVLAVVAAAAMVAVWTLAVPLLVRALSDAGSLLPPAPGLGLAALVCGGPLLGLALLFVLVPVARRHALNALRAGVIATSLVWLGFHAWAWWDRAVLERGDANIGLGLLLLASPLVIVAAMTLAYQFPGRGRRDSS